MFWVEIWKISEFFIWKFSFFGGKIFSIFEEECFCNEWTYWIMWHKLSYTDKCRVHIIELQPVIDLCFAFQWHLRKIRLENTRDISFTLTALWVIQQTIFFFFFSENRPWHCMLIIGDNLHEMSKPILKCQSLFCGKGKKNTSKSHLLKHLPSIPNVIWPL